MLRTDTKISSGSSNDREFALLRRVVDRDRSAFDELYLIYHRRLARFLMRLTPRYEIAEEIINDTLWTVWDKASAFRGASLVSTWIMGIAYRHAMRALRRARVQGAVSFEDAGSFEDKAQTLVDVAQQTAETREWLERAMAELPLEQRMVLEFTYFLGHSCDEISTIMDCPVNTVKTRMFHARQKLKVSLPRLGGSAE
jgi:RNA polymerase sigma-70 factor (ECF subfamily)